MGSVYEAEQEKPRRRVALKVIRQGCASSQALRRFELEAHVLGRLQHPGIAQVYEAGTADSGHGPQPFFAMEYIEGPTLWEYVAQNGLGTRQRLELIAKICDAVQHAHQRGVIHRDLKPGNILVDASGQPKILDFGIARATDSDVQLTTVQTDVGQIIGTVQYMSPEQVAADPHELDIRSDVYALGVITYEILANRPPYDVRRKMIHEAVQIIRENDPIPLSTVNRVFRGDVETIVAKALEKDKVRRYASAAELAADIRHYLHDEPITARPASTVYQLRKFARRNRMLVSSVAAIFLVLVVGMVVSTWQYFAAEAARRGAVAARDEARRDRDRALAAEQKAEANFQLARQAVDKYLNRVAESPALKAHGLESLRLQLLGTAREFYEKFVEQYADDPALRNDLGDAQMNLANISRLIGRTDQAESAYLKARDLFDALRRERPSEPLYRRQLASAHGNLGLLYSDTRRAKEAAHAFENALTIEAELDRVATSQPADRSRLANTSDNFALFLRRNGRIADAEKYHRTAREIRRALVDQFPNDESHLNALMQSLNNLTELYAMTNRAADAEPYLKEAIQISESLSQQHPDMPDYQNGLAASYNNIGGVYILVGRFDDARDAYQRSLPIRERLATEHPAMIEYGLQLGSVYCNLGELETRRGNADAAIPWFRKSITALEGVLRREPRHATARFYLSYTHGWCARGLSKLNRWPDALAEWDAAIKLDDRNDPGLRIGRAATLAATGRYTAAARQLDELGENPALDAESCYGLAEALSLCSLGARNDDSLSDATRGRLCESYETKALQYLRSAAKEAYFNDPARRTEIQASSSFAPLRSRADAREWFSRLENPPAAQPTP